MSHIARPRVQHPRLERNAVGMTRRDYEGAMSTLCAGCGHDSVTAAIVEAFYELDVEPHRVAKVSGIGCSAKTPTYFLGQAHGFNGVHGRMPALATGVAAANRELEIIGISGDGDSLSIGLGQFAHAVRRNVDMTYVLENNGVYGLTKGQFSASADLGSKSKKGVANRQRPIDPVFLALTLGATFVARSFSGDKGQLVPIIEAALSHRGFALVDVISPCVTFNDHEASTKSYRYTREANRPVVVADFVAPATQITASYEEGTARAITMHDGSVVRFRKVPDEYDPTDRDAVYAFLREEHAKGELPTGLLYVEPDSEEMHDLLGTRDEPLWNADFEDLCPGKAALEEIQAKFR
jgi:2-oxoglutarate ferredoxin oxidoreductase subunit beta